MAQFQDLKTRVKLNPETYFKYDGGEHILLKNIHSDDGLSIKYDIMLILYELIHWKSVGELVEPWPPGDQEKIKAHLETLYASRIVITDEAEAAVASESGLSETLGKNIHINVENHHVMLRDYVRMAAYRRAIDRAVTPETVALDLGCGSGVLSFFAAKAGARKIFAIERRSDIIYLAEQLAKANGLDTQIEFVEGASSHISEERLQPKPNLLVAEILANGILEENVLEFTIDARRRFLAPGAQMIPCGLDIYFFGFDCGLHQSRWEEVEEFKDLYGIDFTMLGHVLCGKATMRLDRFNTALHKAVTDPVLVQAIDFMTLENPAFVTRFELVAKEDGPITSFCGYFKAHLDAETVLTNSPWAPPTHWTHLIYTLPATRFVKKGEALQLELIYDGAMRLQLLD